MKKNNYRFDHQEVRRVYRKARPIDMEKFEEAKGLEHETMLKSRKIAEDLNLNMKIGDVEYQGDGNKAIFYYIADDRVDFRQLIKVLAETFKVRIEMKQIGARQEAGRIGGVGPCGRELCCSSWMTSFVSVSTSAARYQDLSLNPQKLAGQCAKLKCCLNYEIDTYVESSRDIPSRDIVLETKDNCYYLFKSDILKRTMTYSTSKDFPANEVTLPVERVKQIIQLNRKGIKVDNLSEVIEIKEKNEFGDILTEDGLDRFDKNKKNKNKKHHDRQKPVQRGDQQRPGNKPQQANASSSNGQAPKQVGQPGKKPSGNPSNKHQNRQNQSPQRPSRFEKPQRNTGNSPEGEKNNPE
jgi:cell fate regulator YaaT (PSP1 superfamily)